MHEKWLIPCNIKFFNLIEHFEHHDEVVWKAYKGFSVGDLAYIYIGVPFKKVMYMCKVVDKDVAPEVLEENQYAVRTKRISYNSRYVKLKLIKKFSDERLSLEVLKENGLGQVQMIARVCQELEYYLDTIDGGDI